MYCKNCGKEIDDKAVICVGCGCAVESNEQVITMPESTIIQTIVKVFMVLSCIAAGLVIIPLIWTIPMTVHYFKATKENRPVSIAFKICSLLFVNMIPGILMFFDGSEN